MAADAHISHRLVVGDEVGCLKVVGTRDDKWNASAVVTKWGEVRVERGVTAMHVAADQAAGDDVAAAAVGCNDGSVRVLRIASAIAPDADIVLPAAKSSNAAQRSMQAIAGVQWLQHSSGDNNGAADRLLTCTRGGTARVHACTADDDNDDVATTSSSWRSMCEFEAAADVLCMAVDGSSKWMAVGGDGTQLCVWDIATRQKCFQAKGCKPNNIGLVDKPYLTAAAFLPGSEGRRVVVGTAQHKLLLYDHTAQKRPVSTLQWSDARITSLAPTSDGSSVWVSNGSGSVQRWNLQSNAMMDALKGIAGSVRSIALHPSQPIIATCGLDRFVHIYDTTTRQHLCKVYLKQHLTACAFAPSIRVTAAAAGDGDDVRDDAGDNGDKHTLKKPKLG